MIEFLKDNYKSIFAMITTILSIINIFISNKSYKVSIFKVKHSLPKGSYNKFFIVIISFFSIIYISILILSIIMTFLIGNILFTNKPFDYIILIFFIAYISINVCCFVVLYKNYLLIKDLFKNDFEKKIPQLTSSTTYQNYFITSFLDDGGYIIRTLEQITNEKCDEYTRINASELTNFRMISPKEYEKILNEKACKCRL